MVQPTLIDAALRGALVALLVTVGVALWPQWRHAQRRDLARVGLGLAASLAVQALSSSPWAEYALECRWQAPGIAVSLGSAVWFWLFARALFDDGFRLRAWHLGLWAAVALLGGTVCEWRPALAGYAAMRAVPIVFALLSLVAVARQWRADLVERRRRWRALVIGGGGLYALGMVAARLHSPDGRLEPTAALVDVTMLLTLTGVIASRLLAPRAAGLWGEPAPVPVPAPAPPRRDPADEALAAALARWMGEQRGYAQEGLSLGSLAERLGAPEYRLRRVINQGLGHRNFNAYVNGLRLAEARRRLADPAERQLPVLSIALDVGFGSIGPFNRAFKAETGLTPTEFRERHLADS